jgi:hypothetical protein
MNGQDKEITDEFMGKITYLTNETKNRNRGNSLLEKNGNSNDTTSIKFSSYIEVENQTDETPKSSMFILENSQKK